jgi:nitroimidazol reductase NimA-like FMN-containing flavoprotein (pyridoxamine 5'-phosphate oxidase superfamily)
MGADYRRSTRTGLGRLPERGRYDRDGVHAILDASPLCQIGYVADGQPLVLATTFWRTGERVFWHGSRESRAIKAMAGAQVCFSVSRLDGLVLARSAFHHSVNYRAVMAFGAAEEVEAEGAKREAFRAMLERFCPGRWATIRQPSRAELAAVRMLSLRLDEVSAKVRSQGPVDAEGDMARAVWAGVAPLVTTPGTCEPCPRLVAGVEPPDGMVDWSALGASA